MGSTSTLVQHFNKKPEYDQVIIINGNDLKDSVKVQNEFFLKHFKNVQILGDGTSHITIEEIKSFFDSLNEVPKTISKKALLIIHHHGNVAQFEGDEHTSHFLANGEKESYPIRIIFQLIKQPIDVILASCHSGAAIHDANLLPSGSRLLALTNENTSLTTMIYKNALLTSKAQQFSLKNLYYNTLLVTSSLGFCSYPVFAVSGENGHIHFVQDDIISIITITDEQKTFLTSKLHEFICPDIPQEACHDKINQYAGAIENIQNIKEINQTFIHQEHLNWFNKVDTNPYSPTADMKREIDKAEEILKYYNITLKINLEKIYNDTDDDTDDDKNIESLTTQELRSALEDYSDDICDHQSEFGTSLAIIAGLNEYNELNS